VPGAAPAPDPISGWDWQTNTLSGAVAAHVLPVDVEYACIFPLATPRDCSGGPSDPMNWYECDCASLGLPPESVPSVCGLKNPAAPIAQGTPEGPIGATPPAATVNDYTTQYFAKAYPTIRELTLANLMGTQGIISSLCPIHTVATSATDPLYGYRPAVNAIVNRLKNKLTSQCFPQPLAITNSGDGGGQTVPCLVLATMPNTPANAAANEATVCDNPALGLSVPDPTVLQTFQQSQHQAFMSGGAIGQDLSLFATCEVNQLPPNSACATDTTKLGWCYVNQTAMLPGSSCQQEIQFTPNSPPMGSIVSLQCLPATGDGGN
jgi:hypothetical protein